MTIPTQSIAVNHNFEAAHRLFLSPGKCQQIHGHSFRAELTLGGPVNAAGFLAGIDFGALKQSFRRFLDTEFDHRILLNENDPWAGDLFPLGDLERTGMRLPGLRRLDCDPTTENLARLIGGWALNRLHAPGITAILVTVDETAVNSANWTWFKEEDRT
ncbi:MAG TPA: 6-carboxytetrahydropterin synthase [Nitrospira sp.]|nr:6-carboxytetrahydropterin synthase [Nitrospira sp.]